MPNPSWIQGEMRIIGPILSWWYEVTVSHIIGVVVSVEPGNLDL